MCSASNITHKPARVKSLAARIAGFEPIWPVLATPLLLFPSRWTPLAAGLLLVPWLVRLVATGRLTVPTPLDGALALLLVTCLGGLLVSPSPAQSMPRFWAVYLGLALFYALAAGLGAPRARRVAGDLAILAGLGLALLTLLGSDWLNARLMAWPVYGSLPLVLRDPAGGDLFNPRVMGMALAVLVPLPLGLALTPGPWGRRLLAAAVSLTMVAVLVLSQALQALLGLAAAVLVLAAWRSRWLLLAVPAGLALLGAGVVAYGPHQLAVDLLTIDHPLGVAVVLRLDMWSRAWAMLRDLPYTGIGLDVFPFVQTNFYPGFVIGPEPHAHNLYLQLALDLGLPGLAAFLWLVLAFARTVALAGRRAERGDRVLLAGSTAGIAAYLAAGLMDTPWATKPGVLLWLLLGLGVAAALGARADLRPAGARRFAPVVALAVLAALAAVLWPGLAARNLGSMAAHRALAAAQAGAPVDEAAMARAVALLEKGLPARPGDGQVHRTLGRLHAWRGDQPAALAALEQSVALDAGDPMARYGPWLPPLRRLTGQEPPPAADDLLWVYRHWNSRYPQRAEGYVVHALAWARYKDDLGRARGVVQAGVDAGAKPDGLLAAVSSLLGSGR